jgi:hypothetical protein
MRCNRTLVTRAIRPIGAAAMCDEDFDSHKYREEAIKTSSDRNFDAIERDATRRKSKCPLFFFATSKSTKTSLVFDDDDVNRCA